MLTNNRKAKQKDYILMCLGMFLASFSLSVIFNEGWPIKLWFISFAVIMQVHEIYYHPVPAQLPPISVIASGAASPFLMIFYMYEGIYKGIVSKANWNTNMIVFFTIWFVPGVLLYTIYFLSEGIILGILTFALGGIWFASALFALSRPFPMEIKRPIRTGVIMSLIFPVVILAWRKLLDEMQKKYR